MKVEIKGVVKSVSELQVLEPSKTKLQIVVVERAARKDDYGDEMQEATPFPFKAFNDRTNQLAKLKVGDKVSAAGYLNSKEYTNKKNEIDYNVYLSLKEIKLVQ